MKVGLVGNGRWGRNIARTLDEMGVLGGVDDLNAPCDLSHCDAIVVATPSPTHAEVALSWLECGKHVLVEKPIAMNSTDAASMIGTARVNEVVLMPGHLMLFNPAVNYAREYVSSGRLGKVIYAYTQRLNLGTIRAGESVIWSLGPHDVSMLSYVLRSKPSLSGCVKVGEDTAFISLDFNGVAANVHLSRLDPHKTRKMTVVGTKGMLVFDDMASDPIAIYDRGVQTSSDYRTVRYGDIRQPYIAPAPPLKSELEYFVAACNDYEIPIDDGYAITKVLEESCLA